MCATLMCIISSQCPEILPIFHLLLHLYLLHGIVIAIGVFLRVALMQPAQQVLASPHQCASIKQICVRPELAPLTTRRTLACTLLLLFTLALSHNTCSGVSICVRLELAPLTTRRTLVHCFCFLQLALSCNTCLHVVKPVCQTLNCCRPNV